MLRLLSSAALFVLFLLATGNDITASEDASAVEARALLQGVENSRRQIPAMELTIEASFKSPLSSNSSILTVAFSERRRRFGVSANNRAEGPRSAYDGERLIIYDGARSAVLRNVDNPTADYLFDPRILGLTATYRPEDSVEDCVGLLKAVSVTLIGKEEIAGHRTTRCRIVDTYEQQHDFWIEANNKFLVHRYEYKYQNLSRQTESDYSRQDLWPLPTGVVSESFHDGKKQDERRFSIVRYKPLISPEPQLFGLAGLDLPVGTALVDIERKVRLGYWDGTKLAPDVPDPADVTRPPPPEASISHVPWLLITNLVIVGVLLIVVAIRYLQPS